MTSQFYVNTAKNGTVITASNAFEAPLYTPLEPQKNYGNCTFVGKIIGVEKVASYYSCCKCEKKIDINHSTVETSTGMCIFFSSTTLTK